MCQKGRISKGDLSSAKYWSFWFLLWCWGGECGLPARQRRQRWCWSIHVTTHVCWPWCTRSTQWAQSWCTHRAAQTHFNKHHVSFIGNAGRNTLRSDINSRTLKWNTSWIIFDRIIWIQFNFGLLRNWSQVWGYFRVFCPCKCVGFWHRRI